MGAYTKCLLRISNFFKSSWDRKRWLTTQSPCIRTPLCSLWTASCERTHTVTMLVSLVVLYRSTSDNYDDVWFCWVAEQVSGPFLKDHGASRHSNYHIKTSGITSSFISRSVFHIHMICRWGILKHLTCEHQSLTVCCLRIWAMRVRSASSMAWYK